MTENPSQVLVKELEKLTFPFQLSTCVLPVSFEKSYPYLSKHIARVQPNIVIATGVAVTRTQITPERVAINWNDARTADNDGVSDRGPCILGAPDRLPSTLPVDHMLELLLGCQVPAAISDSAGSYVCNQVMYRLLFELQGTSVQAGFVHIPPPSAAISMEQMVKAFRAMLLGMA